MTRRGWAWIVAAGLLAGCGKAPEPPAAGQVPASTPAASEEPAKPAAPAMSEKQKAQTEPYANDLGPVALPADLLASYPAAIKAGYELMLVRCAQCHTPSRPLNSEIVTSDAWKRYVKRMMAKPGCAITGPEGKQIWEFLTHDSKVRKTGGAAAGWKAHRADLLEQFKAKYPARYKLLYTAASS